MTANELITASFKKLGIIAAEQSIQAHMLQDGIEAINLMLKSWQAQGLHLWLNEEGVIFFDVGKTDYLLGPSGDEATTLDDFVGTTTTSALVTTTVIIPVASSAGMTANDKFGIELDDGTRQWTTISTVDSATQVTIATGLTGAAASGNTVFTFTSLIDRPLRMSSARRKTYGEDNEIATNQWSRQEYFDQPNKVSQGTLVNWYYSPLLTNGRFYAWQTASSVNDYARITFERPIEDIDVSTETLDIPVEWLDTVIYNLAARLTDDYKVPVQREDKIIAKAGLLLDQSLGFDEETGTMNVQPDFG
jgi:hypothetical protein